MISPVCTEDQNLELLRAQHTAFHKLSTVAIFAVQAL
jgi:hypothetical protein